jgi:hypothetical protein
VPQPNDAELTRLVACSAGTEIPDDEPNTGSPGGAPAASFTLLLEAVAGSAIGNNAAPYILDLVCIDETLAAPNSTMSVPGVAQAFNGASGWTLAGGNFIKTESFSIPVPAGVAGHVFHYIATLVDQAGQVVSFIHSPPFILV